MNALHDSRLPRTKTLGWDEVRQFFEDHGCVVTDHPEIRWYRESWEALDKAGLTSTTQYQTSELAQTVLRLRALCLLTMYLGVYQAAGPYSELAGYFWEHPDVSCYLDSLDVQMKDIWELARTSGMLEKANATSYGEDEDADDGQLCEIVMDLAREENKVIFDTLSEHYGGVVELFVSLWNSRMSPDEAESILSAVNVLEPIGSKLAIWSYVEEGMTDWSWS